jgi:FKBP-type peptidyl-prolyl cis-trans isomerase SlyD
MTIKKHSVVSVKYTLHSPNQLTGEEVHIESTTDNNPLTWLYGTGSMIPDFEKNLADKPVGHQFDFRITAANAYGMISPDHIVDIPLDVFRSPDGVVDKDVVKIGNTIPMQDNQGHQMRGVVKEISLTTVKMDFNHPMAGRDLHFTGEVLEVRDATKDEIAHGHVHGPGGHHH